MSIVNTKKQNKSLIYLILALVCLSLLYNAMMHVGIPEMRLEPTIDSTASSQLSASTQREILTDRDDTDMISSNISTKAPIASNTEKDELYSYLLHDQQQNRTRLDEWKLYRLGDMVRHEGWANHVLGYQYHKQNYPNSIATQYLSHSNDTGFKFGDMQLLMNIVRDRTIDVDSTAYAVVHSIDYNQTLIVHLRTGDVIDHDGQDAGGHLKRHRKETSVEDFLNSTVSTRPRYVKGRQYYVEAMKRFKIYDLQKVLIITAFHTGGHYNLTANYTKSSLYIQEIMKLFAMNGYEVALRLNESPDDDFVIMCSSQYFVKSGGGFSQLVGNIVRLNGGIVYGKK